MNAHAIGTLVLACRESRADFLASLDAIAELLTEHARLCCSVRSLGNMDTDERLARLGDAYERMVKLSINDLQRHYNVMNSQTTEMLIPWRPY